MRAHVDIVSCYICAWAIYGAQEIELLIDTQRHQLRPRRRPLAALKATKEPPNWPSCALTDCSSPAKARERDGAPLKYCSKECRLRNAHRRENKRKVLARK